MAPSPFRRRKAAKTLRNLAIAEAALALAKDRVGRGSKRPTGKLIAIGGAVVAAGAAGAALLKRDKIAGLLPSRSGEPEPPAPAPPQPSSYDAPGPATPVPAPDPHGETADEAQRPPAEAGEGAAEGKEQTEAGQAGAASEPLASPDPAAMPGGGISGRPFSGLEHGDEGAPATDPASASGAAESGEDQPETGNFPPRDAAGAATGEGDAAGEAAASERPTTSDQPTTSDESAADEDAAAGDQSGDDEGRTWSGRSASP